jgi:hypothetical protein
VRINRMQNPETDFARDCRLFQPAYPDSEVRVNELTSMTIGCCGLVAHSSTQRDLASPNRR